MSEVVDFVTAYQAVTPLTMGELWALPIFLRFVLVERLAEAVARLTEQETQEASDGRDHAESVDDQAVGDAIVGLRAVNNADWAELFEALSLVHQIFTSRPGAHLCRDDHRDARSISRRGGRPGAP